MPEAVTNCPACGTSFQVTEEQLLGADGSIRCAECLHFFKAEDHFISPMLDMTELLAIEQDYWTDFEAYTKHLMLGGEGFFDKRLVNENSGAEVSGSRQFPRRLLQITEPEAVLPAISAEDYWELTDTDQADASDGASIWERQERTLSNEGQPVSKIARRITFSTFLVGENKWSGLSKSDDSYEAKDSTLNFKLIRNLFTLQSLKSSSGILALLILLFLQYAYLGMEQFAHEARYRPYYESTCRYLGCTVPEFHDLSRLQPRELVVRSHPTEEEALIADALLRNSAEYRQLFPNLRLRFFDMDGNIVARRVFNASEYLGGEMRGLRFIPGHTEVRFSLEIVDPGTEALGYQMDVVPYRVPN